MIEYIDPRKTERIYGVGRLRAKPLQLLLYAVITSAVTGIFAFLVMRKFVLDTSEEGVTTLPPEIYQIAAGVAVVNIPVILLIMYVIDPEEVAYQIRDYMWDSMLRPLGVVFTIAVSAGALLIAEFLPVFGFSALIAVIIALLLNLLGLPVPEGWILFTISVVIFLAIVASIYPLWRRKLRQRQEELAEDASTALRFKYEITAYIPGFVGLKNGDVYVIDRQMYLRTRSNAVTQILNIDPYLLIRDNKGVVYMWRQDDGYWEYVGHLQWLDENTISFRRENGYRETVKGIQYFGDILGIRVTFGYYLTDTIAETMSISDHYERYTISYTVRDGTIYRLRKKGANNLFSIEFTGKTSGVIMLGEVPLETATKAWYMSKWLWVFIGNRLMKFSLPDGKEMTEYTFPGSRARRYRFLSTGGEPAFLSNLEKILGIPRDYLMLEPDAEVHYRIKYWVDKIYRYDGELHVAVYDTFFKLPLSALDEVPRDEL